MIYLRLFDLHSEYVDFIETNDYILPNVSYCKNGGSDVHYNPYEIEDEYVDLGLPSGLKWARWNLGARKETDYGLFYAWGEIIGYKSPYGTKKFTWEDYKWSNGGGTIDDMTKYNMTDWKMILEPEDDAAYQATNGVYRMPTYTEYNELTNSEYTTHQSVTDYNGSGVNGTLFTSLSNGNTLFFPASGSSYDNVRHNRGYYTQVWSTQVVSGNQQTAWSMDMHVNGGVQLYPISRYMGHSIRGVLNS